MSVSNRYTGGGGRKGGAGGVAGAGGAGPYQCASSEPILGQSPSPLPLPALLVSPLPPPPVCCSVCSSVGGGGGTWGAAGGRGAGIKLASFTTLPLAGLVKVRRVAANSKNALR